MNLANIETNFQRLLIKCEELAEKQEPDNWRFEKYVMSLEDLLLKMNKLHAKKLSQDTLKDYSKRCDFLKQLTLLNRKTADSSENLDHNLAINNPGQIFTKKDIKPKQIYHKVQLNQENSLRNQLLGKDNSKNETNELDDIDINKLLSEQHNNQEKLALEMLKSVESIKNNSLAARKIVASDNDQLNKMDSDAEKNSKNLAMNSNRLNDHVSKSCNCWIWLMIFLIMIIFVMMVLFMKLFPKKQIYDQGIEFDGVAENMTIFNNDTILIGNETMHKIEL